MKLVDDLINDATSSEVTIASLLRRFLVLAYALKNKQLQEWIEAELNGYDPKDEATIPEYRKITAFAKGLFVGPAGASIRDQPISAHILQKEHRHFALTLTLFQPIASYEHGGSADDKAIVEWPPFLVVLYQSKFIQGFNLNRAWQEIPAAAMIGLLDTVRNRVLKFALELREELGEVADKVDAVPAKFIERNVTNIIYGGHNVFGGTQHATTNVIQINIAKGARIELDSALTDLGLSAIDLAHLHTALDEDAAKPEKDGIGTRTKDWLKSAPAKLAAEGAKIGGEVARALITQWLRQYLGLPLS
ncbi:MAG TPA: hypothetical protein VGH23_02075 [Rhizomicrobium sp.]|jgi:hypothetical protein